MNNTKHGPEREFRPDEIEHYAQFREQRAAQRPAQCTYGSPCWVTDGPPALNGHTCRGCEGRPDSLRRWAVPQ